MSGEPELATWDGMIEYLISLGYNDEEIEAEFDRSVARSSRGQEIATTRSGEMLDWGSLHDKGRVKGLLAGIRGAQSEGDASRNQIERMAAVANEIRELDGTLPTQAALAERLQVTERRIRQVGWKAIRARADEMNRGGTSA